MPTESPQHETDWTSIYQRLQAGEYEVAARLLLDMQIASLNVGDSTSAGAAAAARQLCLALVSYRAEIEWHQLAQGNAELRQRAVSQNVLSLLSLVRDDPMSQVRGGIGDMAADTIRDDAGAADASEHINVWQRIQNLLERQRPAGPSLREGPLSDDPSDLQEEVPLPTSLAEPSPKEVEDDLHPASEPTIAEEASISEPATVEGLPPMQPATTEVEPPSAATDEQVVAPLPIQSPDSASELAESVATHTERASDSTVDVPSSEDEPPALAIYCLGSFRIHQHGRSIEHWNGLKGLSIIKYLAAHRGVPVSKDVLMDVFWPDADLEAARRNLHQAIYSLRQTLRRRDPDIQHIRFDNNQYFLNPKLDIWVDVEEFEDHVRRGRVLEFADKVDEALTEYEIADSNYQGAFLEEDMYEDWPHSRREHLRNTYLEIADHLSKQLVQQGAYAAAIGLCQKQLGQDNCYENAHRRLMRCYLAQRQRNLAIRQYQTCVQILREELDVPPSEETVALYAEIVSPQ